MGYLECYEGVVNPDGSITGKILATGFTNDAFPFIRYLVGDSATWAPPDYQCPCGRKSQILWAIDGRNEDYVLASNGNKIMRFDYFFKDTPSILEAQVVQRKIGKIIIRYVPRHLKISDADISSIRYINEHYIGAGLTLEFEKVQFIDRTASGKFKAVLSELSTIL